MKPRVAAFWFISLSYDPRGKETSAKQFVDKCESRHVYCVNKSSVFAAISVFSGVTLHLHAECTPHLHDGSNGLYMILIKMNRP